MSIQILAPDVAAKIAAGEVVERPANVVKELLENSLDAGATEIRVEIRDGGQRLLRVSDNGHGIPAAEAPRAFARHATSKLAQVDDLNHIATFGFRGEALYSIAAVSQLTLTTRHEDEEFAVQLRLEGGHLKEQSRAGAPVGTVVTVEHLFFNMPARKKFLRKAPTEAGRISSVVQTYALAYPERRFSFVNEGRLLFQSAGTGDLFDVLAKVYGLENAKQLVPIGASASGERAGKPGVAPLLGDLDEEVDFGAPGSSAGDRAAPASPTVRVAGYTSLPTLTRANRTNIHLFVNRRYVEDRSLTYAVIQAYHTLLPGGRYPLAVILVDVDPAQVDVNVHPQKTQVRFVQERQVFGAIQKTVRRAMLDHAVIPDVALSPDGQPPAPSTGALPPPGGDPRDGWAMRRELIVGAGQQPNLDIYIPAADAPTARQAPPNQAGANQAGANQAGANQAGANQAGANQLAPHPEPAADAPEAIDQPRSSTQPPLAAHTSQLPPLRVVGQVGTMYIVAEGPEGLYLIDQHAAHERILYEKFMAQRYGTQQGDVARQQLLEPLTLHVGDELTGLVSQHMTALNRVGFEVENFGGDTFLVRAVPSVLSGDDPLRSVEEIVHSLAERRNLVEEELEARLVKMVCKRAAIKAGQQLSLLEMRELLHQLEACQAPRTCPHGRPTMIQLSAGELEKAFGRI